jgi:hypothetical protein
MKSKAGEMWCENCQMPVVMEAGERKCLLIIPPLLLLTPLSTAPLLLPLRCPTLTSHSLPYANALPLLSL